jgi:hypothetical protein
LVCKFPVKPELGLQNTTTLSHWGRISLSRENPLQS